MAITRHDCITCNVRNCSILDDCDRDTLTAISTYKISKQLRKGERLFSEGDPIRGVCFIKKGFLKVELNGKQGRPLILRLAGRGTIFGHRANSRHALHPCSATALSDVHYCYIPIDLFTEIKCKSDSLKQQILNLFLDELEVAEKKAVHLAHKSVRERVAESILMIADAYQYEESKQSFRISLCRQDMADLAGTTKEQVSKALKDFEKEGLIKCAAKRFNYLNTSALRSVAENTPSTNDLTRSA